MSNEQNPKYTETELKQAQKMNEKTAQQIGRLSMENASLAARNEILEEEKMILAQHIQQQAEKINQYENMLNIQEGEAAEGKSELTKAVEAANKNEDAGKIVGGIIDASEISKPNREQRRQKEKVKKG